MKQSMKAALIHRFEGIESIEIEEISVPLPKPDEIQVAIKYAGVNPVDWKIAEGVLKNRMDYTFPITLGWDMSGEISALGENIKELKIGDPVFAYCRKNRIQDGTYAEFICIEAKHAAAKPKSLSFAEAAVIPLSCLTAWQVLYEAAHLKAKETILIHAGAGGVGGYAIQLAKRTGAFVFATASASNFDYVKRLGADIVIDYKKTDFLEAVRNTNPQGVDVVFDTVGGDTLLSSYAATKQEGRLITIVAGIGAIDQALAAERRLKTAFVFVRPDGKQLQNISELLDAGELIAPPVEEFPFEKAREALRKSKSGHTQGKLVLKI